jgi:hypothetical protein
MAVRKMATTRRLLDITANKGRYYWRRRIHHAAAPVISSHSDHRHSYRSFVAGSSKRSISHLVIICIGPKRSLIAAGFFVLAVA